MVYIINMNKHLKYLRYVVRHKWFTFLECANMGLYWRGLVHDLSKFLPCEWYPYVEHFYGDAQNEPEYDLAWLHHQKFNKHHWQYWLLQKDSGECKAVKMPVDYVKEMVCDWKGVSRAFNKPDGATLEWYEQNKSKMILHPTTRVIVEALLKGY